MNVETLRLLVAKGLSPEDILAVAETLDAPKARSAAAERQARYRARQKGISTDDSPESVTGYVTRDVTSVTPVSLPLPPNENKSNPPTPTHPDGDTPPARKATRFPSEFPCPAWADEPVWADFLKNRKAKRLPNTATAHRKFVQAVEVMADEAWPPGRLLEAIVARGWAGAYDPRENRNDRPVQSSSAAAVHRSPAARPADSRDGFTRALDERIFGAGSSPH